MANVNRYQCLHSLGSHHIPSHSVGVGLCFFLTESEVTLGLAHRTGRVLCPVLCFYSFRSVFLEIGDDISPLALAVLQNSKIPKISVGLRAIS